VFGSAISAIIDSGGTQNVISGGIASDTMILGGGIQYDAGTASNTDLAGLGPFLGGTQVVFGSAVSSTVGNGGTQSVAAGGTASATTVSSFGIQYDAGTASDTVLAGGTQIVTSGGAINGETISAGTLELQNGAAGSSTITFSGGGTLQLDGTGAYGFLVAGFAVPDMFDLSAINFASATKQYSGNTSSGTLTVGDGTHSASILLLGNYSLASFNLGAETGGATGTVVTDPPVSGSGAIAPPHG
jgi:autotransporter passenger strand-loop-strand repeat protein